MIMTFLRRESVAEVVTIAYHPVTGVDLTDLLDKLSLYSTRKLKIGAFSAASNVTGILTDVDAVAIMMHKAGGLAVFDYATAAPYVKVCYATFQRYSIITLYSHNLHPCLRWT